MVRNIVDGGHARSEAVQDALNVVPRHRFFADVPLCDAYDHRQALAATPEPTAEPRPGSSIAPITAAMMLDQADIRPGHTVLLIGTGTGYTAALAAELADAGRVVTIERDQALASHARRTLRALGYARIEVITASVSDGAPGRYDRIIVTASAYDIPDAWIRQLAPEGRLIVPLRLRGGSRSFVFQEHDGVVQARDSRPCSLPRLLGADHDLQHTSALGPGGRLILSWDEDQRPLIERYELYVPGSHQDIAQEWFGVIVGEGDPLDRLWLWLAATAAETCGLAVKSDLPGIPAPAFPTGTPAIVQHRTIAYLTRRELPAAPDGTRLYQLGAGAFGPFAHRQATAYCEQLRAWSWTRSSHPSITVFPADTPDEHLPPDGQRLRRPSQWLVLREASTT
ncbi:MULTISPECIES: rRNA adenine N-6-methyltransferase family protein [unclassified Amycolatopsis]|uniref:rRNA adenine N-6-methyltransferase family protein n=1 Tax=unclassified Amycolatopsis TaxID=2618356 RepID=UPI00287B9DFD|nr:MULTISPECIES: rRNA adenine N-6-methyltransferase family protein [unclassified Amycolatopsis]